MSDSLQDAAHTLHREGLGERDRERNVPRYQYWLARVEPEPKSATLKQVRAQDFSASFAPSIALRSSHQLTGANTHCATTHASVASACHTSRPSHSTRNTLKNLTNSVVWYRSSWLRMK